MRFNTAGGNNSGYGYVSGSFSHRTYHKLIGVDQAQFRLTVQPALLTAANS